MELTILGSAAAEGIPAVFCGCPVCQKAWKNGGKDFRLCTAYKLSDTVRVDMGPCSLEQEYRFNLHSENLRHLIFTHPHEDHLNPSWLYYRWDGFSHTPDDTPLNVYGPDEVFRTIRSTLKGCDPIVNAKMAFHTLNSGDTVELPDVDMTLYPMLANHSFRTMALIYVIRNRDKYILIGNDTGYFTPEAWERLAQLDIKLDVAILDCTCVKSDEAWDGHMGRKAVLAVQKRLREMGRIDDHTQVFVNHFSHNGGYVHDELVDLFAPDGIQVGYDGCVITY